MITALFLASMCLAEVPSMAVIPVIAGKGDARISTQSISAQSIADEVGNASRGRAIRVMTHEDLFVAENSDLAQAVRACGTDEDCMSSRLSAVRAQLGAVVIVNAIADPPIVAVRLIDVRERRVVAAAIGPLENGEATILEAVRLRMARLLDERGIWRSKEVVAVQPPPLPVVHEESSIASSPWLWIAIGAVVAGGVTAAVIIGSGGSNSCVCIGPREDCPPC